MRALLLRTGAILAVSAGLFASTAAPAAEMTLLVLPAEGSGTAQADGAIVTNMQQDSSPCPTQFPGAMRQNAVVLGAAARGTGSLRPVWRVQQLGEQIGTVESAGTKFCTCQEFVNEPCSGGTLTTITRLRVRIQSSPSEWVDCNDNGLKDAGDCQ